jgi:hypothetical protein
MMLEKWHVAVRMGDRNDKDTVNASKIVIA